MEELFKELFDSLPHVKQIWVDADMNAYIHPRKGCEVVKRSGEVEPVAETVEGNENKKPKVKNKR